MQDIELDDGFWRDALAALRSGSRASLAADHPALSRLLADLEAEARRDATLLGVRLGGAEPNGRLLAFLLAAFMARAGVRTVLVDLSPDLRWLEHLLQEDLKEGIVDHVQYGVPLERCVHATALPHLSALTGGATFLAGSALDDAPGLRGTLDKLRQRYRAVVVALPSPEAADGAGITALCDALVTVEGPAGASVVGRERAIARVVGDPQAAWDLARLTQRFLGPLPALLAGAAADPAPMAAPAPRPAATTEEVAFLAAFETRGGTGPEDEAEAPTPASLRIEDVDDASALGRAFEAPAWRPPRERRTGRRAAALLGVAGLLVLAVWVGRRQLAPLLAGARDEAPPLAAAAGEPAESYRLDGGAEEGGTVVPLEPGGPSADGPAARPTVEAGLLDGGPAEADPGRPAPFSVHVGSFQQERSGADVVARLRAAGYEAYLAPVDLPARGRWHRVYVGAYGDSAEAGAVRTRLLGGDAVQEAVVRPTPWTFQLGAFDTRAEAEARRAELGRRGVTAYVAGSDPFRLYAGAYASREEAAALAPELETGPEGPVLTRRGL